MKEHETDIKEHETDIKEHETEFVKADYFFKFLKF